MVDIKVLEKKAKKLGASEFGVSDKKEKRFYVIYQNKKINFGSRTGSTYIDHRNKIKRDAWIARHSKVRNKRGEYVINDPTSASFWSHRILW